SRWSAPRRSARRCSTPCSAPRRSSSTRRRRRPAPAPSRRRRSAPHNPRRRVVQFGGVARGASNSFHSLTFAASVRRIIAIATVGVIVLLLVVAQLVLPGIAEQRLRDRLSRNGTVIQVHVSAFPAIELLWHHADR